MKRLLMLIPLVFLCCLSCQQDKQLVSTNGGESPRFSPDGTEIYFDNVEADIQAIKDIVADFNVAVNTSDIEKAAFYHADEAIVIPPNRPPLIGKDASISDLQQLFDQFNILEVDVVKDVQVSGDLAVAHYTWSATAAPKPGGKPLEENGNGVMVLRKKPENVWKFTYLIWSNEALISPQQKE